MTQIKSEFNIPKIENRIKLVVLRRLALASEFVTSSAKLKCPVDTGRLRDSIQYKLDSFKLQAIIGTNVEYAPYVEFGSGEKAEGGNGRKGGWYFKDDKGKWRFTKGGKPQPFLRPALFENLDEVKKIINGK